VPGDLPDRPTWISLGAASKLMGVSESTLRRWADDGQVRSYRTAGGHRRILEEDLQHIAASTPATGSSRDTDRISDIATARVKRRLSPRGRPGQGFPSFEGLTGDTRDHLRLLGRQLVDLFARYIASDSRRERYTKDARTMGRQYGLTLVGASVGLTAAIGTFNSLRRSLEETASQIATEAGLSTEDAVEAIENILVLADVVLEGIASVYEERVSR